MAQKQTSFQEAQGLVQSANPDNPSRQSMFDECFCQSTTPAVIQSDAQVKQDAARSVFGAKTEVLAQAFSQELHGRPIRDQLIDQVVASLPQSKQFMYNHETFQQNEADFGTAFGNAAHANQNPYRPVDQPMHNRVLASEGKIECQLIQNVWAGMTIDQRQKLDAELDARMEAAKANGLMVDLSLPANGSALAQFDGQVVKLVSQYLRDR